MGEQTKSIRIAFPTAAHEWWAMLSGRLFIPSVSEDAFGRLTTTNRFWVVSAKAGGIERLEFPRQLERLYVILWDGQRDYNELAPELIRLQNQSFDTELLFVGDLSKEKAGGNVSIRRLFDAQTEDSLLENVKIAKKRFPRCFVRHGFRHFAMPVRNFLKEPAISLQYYFGRKRVVYFGAIGPSRKQKAKWQVLYGGSDAFWENVFARVKTLEDLVSRFEILKGISMAGETAAGYLGKTDRHELFSVALRSLTLDFLEARGHYCTKADYFKDQSFNAYQSYFGARHVHLDFGGKLGSESIYPRSADIVALNKRYESIFPNAIIEASDRSAIRSILGDFIRRIEDDLR